MKLKRYETFESQDMSEKLMPSEFLHPIVKKIAGVKSSVRDNAKWAEETAANLNKIRPKSAMVADKDGKKVVYYIHPEQMSIAMVIHQDEVEFFKRLRITKQVDKDVIGSIKDDSGNPHKSIDVIKFEDANKEVSEAVKFEKAKFPVAYADEDGLGVFYFESPELLYLIFRTPLGKPDDTGGWPITDINKITDIKEIMEYYNDCQGPFDEDTVPMERVDKKSEYFRDIKEDLDKFGPRFIKESVDESLITFSNAKKWINDLMKFLSQPWSTEEEKEIVSTLLKDKKELVKAPIAAFDYLQKWNDANKELLDRLLGSASDEFSDWYANLVAGKVTELTNESRTNEGMKNIKSFSDLSEDNTLTMDQLRPHEKFIHDTWGALDMFDQKQRDQFFKSLENTWGEKVAKIVDGQWSADKLHYNQKMDAEEFVANFDEIKDYIDNLIVLISI